jgi:hypothetical protein
MMMVDFSPAKRFEPDLFQLIEFSLPLFHSLPPLKKSTPISQNAQQDSCPANKVKRNLRAGEDLRMLRVQGIDYKR